MNPIRQGRRFRLIAQPARVLDAKFKLATLFVSPHPHHRRRIARLHVVAGITPNP